MSTRPDDPIWEERLRADLGSAPEPNFDAWSKKFPDAIAALSPGAPAAILPQDRRGRGTAARSFTWLAASVLVVAGLLWMVLGGGGDLSPSAFAESIPGVDNVQTMTWTTTTFIRFTSEDGKRTWIQEQRVLHAYRHPGQYREIRLDEGGAPRSISITDYRAGRTLLLVPGEKTATLKFPADRCDVRGPFAWVGDMIRKRTNGEWRVTSVSLKGQREIDGIQANVVRTRSRSVETPGTRQSDFLFDTSSKQLVGILSDNIPGADELDDRIHPPEDRWSKMEPVGSIYHEMIINPRLNPSDFTLDPPADYAFEKIARPTVTEEEMIAYLGAAARFNENQFPDSPYNAIDREKFNAASEKPPAGRTEAEQAMIDIHDRIMRREIHESAVKRFVDDQTVPDSFHYVGAGVKVGQSDQVVAWYRFRNETKYRVLYGDLSVRDASEAELPLRLSN
jgi:hypothetical protein